MSELKFRWLANTFFLTLCAIVGGVIGMLVFKPLLGKSEAIGVIVIGSVGAGDSYAPLEQVGSLTARMPAAGFAAAVAKRLSDPDVARQLLAPVYGGSGGLTARALRDANKIEIRVSNDSEKIAVERLAAAIDEVLAEHEAIAAKFLQLIITRRDRYQDMLADVEDLDRQIATKIAAASSGSADFDGLLAARSKVVEQITTITQSLIQLDQSTREPYFKRTELIAGPSPLRPALKSAWQTALLGGIAGFALGLIVVQIRRAIV